MLINSIDISQFGVVLYDRVISSNNISTKEVWADGDIQPTYIRQQDSFKTIKLEFLVLDNNEETAFITISKLTNLLKKSSIVFDDMDLVFDTTMVGQCKTTRLKNGSFIASYQLQSDYAKGEREIYTTNASLTNSFKLTILYYKNNSSLLASDVLTIREGDFTNNTTLSDIGINVNKYLPPYFNNGIATNLTEQLTYEGLKQLGTLIVNYTPIQYNLNVSYFLNDGNGYYNKLVDTQIQFTQEKLNSVSTIGQLVNIKLYQPTGYKATVGYDGPLTIDSLLAVGTVSVFYDMVENEQTKTISLIYKKEVDDEYVVINTKTILVKESEIYDGSLLKDFINTNTYKPDKYYNNGFIDGFSGNELITYEDLLTTYTIKYNLSVNNIFVEYYLGTYPDWYRVSSVLLPTKYNTEFENSFSIEDLDLDVDRYHTAEYNTGLIYNADNYDTYDEVLNIGVIQVYYTPIDFTISVNYVVDDDTTNETYTITALDFLNNPILSDIIPIQDNKPEGYQFDPDNSYSGEVSLAGLLQASPITITYVEIQAERTKNIIVKYKQELSSAYSTINTSLFTISESDCVGGVRLKDLFPLNQYKPDYYENGVIDGVSSSLVFTFDELDSSYDILYLATQYTTIVKYYRDSVSDLNWVGSSYIQYKVFDFSVSTTLYDLGLNLNAYKPANCDNGEIQYNGPINFSALRSLNSINITYRQLTEPEDPSGINYPHRFLFLQHNDLGEYESLHPEWTMNHAYINTGFTAEDMSKITIIMECGRVDDLTPLHNVNAGYAYLFGSSSTLGSFYMRFNNQTQFGSNLSGVNTYEAKAGYYTNNLVLTEENAIGWSETSGIYTSEALGKSNATFTYTSQMESEAAPMPYPIYLFANNNGGNYEGGLAGIGIYGCRIYYDGQLMRDFIPVQFYDLIGDKVAPSNCLYDKISQSFFEDGTGMNSFNIIDDTRFEDNDPTHKIGHSYVQYYKGNDLIQSATYFFRGSDFEDGPINPYELFKVDYFRPDYYGPGQIENIDNLIFDFDHMNNTVYKVIYPVISNSITVNYYTGTAENATLLHTDVLPITEQMFYQSPTFGDIVRLNKYKPDGYKTDFVFPGRKVSMGQVLENAPYDIYYTPVEDEESYSTVIRYIKKVYGIRAYETLGTTTLTLADSDFRDGEYIDFYIDFDAMKPDDYYTSGEPYQWYLLDERLDSSSKLKDLYTIVYNVEPQSIDINYYVDTVSEESLIASKSWEISIDDFDPDYTFTLPDVLPNNFINIYQPLNCSGGIIQNSSTQYTFFTLVEAGEISVVYTTVVQPHDPTTAMYEPKVLYWDARGNLWNYNWNMEDYLSCGEIGGKIPYIDLGYKPKELSRLRVELKCYNKPWGFTSNTTSWGYHGDDYSYFFGYYGTINEPMLGVQGAENILLHQSLGNIGTDSYSKISPNSSGCFAIKGRLPIASGYVYTAEGPQSIDNQTFYSAGTGTGVISGSPKVNKVGISGVFRNGYAYDFDDNYEEIRVNNDYIISKTDNVNVNATISDYSPCLCLGRDNEDYTRISSPAGNPYTIILDAFNSYGSIWQEGTNNDPTVFDWDRTEDLDLFEDRCQPKGTLTLFTTTNPTNGKVNIMPIMPYTYPFLGSSGSQQLSGQTAGQNPFSADFNPSIIEKIYTIVQDPNSTTGEVILQETTVSKNLQFASFKVPCFPGNSGCAVWGIKIYDQDRLVRDLIPVAKDDVIYDYTMPDNGLFDLVSEIFFGNANKGGTYTMETFFPENGGGHSYTSRTITVNPEDVYSLNTILDPLYYGNSVCNYYDYDSSFLGNQFVRIPTWFNRNNTTIENILQFNDYKPDDFHLDGFLDIDEDITVSNVSLSQMFEMGSYNVIYKLRTFTKTIVYYQDNVRVGSKDVFYSLEDIDNATTLDDLGIDVDLYYDENFKHGRIVFDETILEDDNIEAFIDAPSPIVVYDKLTKEEAPNLLYLEYYRGGASDDDLITINEDSVNYLDCDLTAKVLNPHGAIKYYNHYHQALYEDESYDYFIPYQVEVLNHYTGIHRGPAKKYPTLAMIVREDTLTIIEERNGWGRLREYPLGWILLNQTRPITGPGQNPEYDEATDSTATIPFGEEIDISMMTIDRLWCYAPDYESWIKAEDISFDQAGKLYNGLKLEIIDLDDLDFTEVNNLSDMGIYPQKFKLRFHNNASYNYTGDYTYEAFSDIHNIDFVYPETNYTYTCIYYKDNISDDNELGRTAFSCSISDWNPDWDTVIATSYQTEIVKDYGYISLTPQNYQSINVYSQPSNTSTLVKGYNESIVLRITEDTVSGYVPVEELNGTNSGYVKLSNNPGGMVSIRKEYGSETLVQKDPTLYRDTEITLDWDYFGFGRNTFKPTGYGDGIYIWNPRTWDVDNIKFSFQELIRCGTQRVLYPIFDKDTYKIAIYRNNLGDSKTNSSYRYQAINPGISVDLSNSNEAYFTTNPTISTYENSNYDLTLEGEFYPLPGSKLRVYNSTDSIQQDWTATKLLTSTFVDRVDSSTVNKDRIKIETPYITIGNTRQWEDISNRLFEYGDSFKINMSNYRNLPDLIVGVYKNNDFDYYYYNGYTSNLYDMIKIDDTTNLNNKGQIDTQFAIDISANETNSIRLYSVSNITNNPFVDTAKHIYGVIHNLVSYDAFNMIHYWVPVPKGLWYKYDGETLRIPENGLFDLLTGKFSTGYKLDSEKTLTAYIDQYNSLTFNPTIDGLEEIYLRTQNINSQPYNLFDNWNYTSTDYSAVVALSADTRSYNKPDVYSNRSDTLLSGTIIPISKYTNDSENQVVGEWYYSSGKWFESSNATISTGLNAGTLSKGQFDIALIPQPGNETFNNIKVGKNPNTFTFSTNYISYGSQPMARTVYYTYTFTQDDYERTFYFDGQLWIPKEITDKLQTQHNKNYTITRTTPCYRLPVADFDLKISDYLYGDRITVPYVATRDTNWGYTGIGWIQLTNNVSEVL